RSTRSRTSKDDRVGTFRDSVALVWLLWLESRCPASNVEVVAGDFFATSNPLTSQTEKNLLSPFSNIRAITPKFCARSSLAIVAGHGVEVLAPAPYVPRKRFRSIIFRRNTWPMVVPGASRSRHVAFLKQSCGFSTQVRNGICCRKAIPTTKRYIGAFRPVPR